MSRSRRVVVTGLGPVSSIGIGAEEFRALLFAGESGISPVESFDSSVFQATLAGEVKNFDPADIVENINPRRWGRTAQLAAAAARLAARDAGLDLDQETRLRTGVVIGTTNGESQALDELTVQWHERGPGCMAPTVVRQIPAGNIAAAVATELQVEGDVMCLPTACSAANYAIGSAADSIATGSADVMLAGGADSVNRTTHAGFMSLGAIAKKLPQPFDADRSGIVTAEGGAVLVLEELSHALRRGAPIYAEVLGYGLNCDAHHIVHPDATSISECIRRTLAQADITPDDVDYICAHGTGTPTNDVTEVSATRMVYGDNHPPVSSIKSMLGHTMGAASGFGAIACCQAIQIQKLPPTTNLKTVDPELGEGIDFVAGSSRPARVRTALNHGFAFGGNNAITVFSEFHEDSTDKEV
ncbi:beta-ketoacyl-[acyl-carrier-protein] synthase family protein [Actinomyces lilanjuaniae]|uniref:3-oxoacyl-[acyl-carrier-protein] synthase 1 n=1 Tax=Actinomyces lilanjuaniae TaxID=2321394 RepID=A0ABM6Z0Z7_9ACTO|nr:beta-ketoacyl-[acyl-carrier-protein] synthase family protein [Actinomyces lilanjuaniae]AYD88886.1 beta-ketoacyl-[acyl-carrier-protein] synthase family protein [Actinomyces lilanjuaniae]